MNLSSESQRRCRTSEFLVLADQLPRWIAYLFAVVLALAMLLVRMNIAVVFGNGAMLIFFMLPIILSSVLGGFGPGLAATAIASIGVDYFLIPPLYSLRIAESHDLFQWFILIICGILCSYLSELLHRARRQAEERRMMQEIAQDELERSEARFSTIFNASPMGIDLVQVNDGRISHANDAFLQTFGYSREELIGRTSTELGLYIDPDDRERLFALIRERKRVVDFETRFRRKSGEIGTVLLYAEPIELGVEQYSLGIVIDITERKKIEESMKHSEMRFRTLSRLSSDFAYSCCHTRDGGYVVDWITDTFYVLTGISESELKDLRCWMNLTHPEDREMATEPLRRLQPGECDTRDFRIIAKNGRILTVTNHMECESDPAVQGGLRIYGSVQDITERKKAEEALRESENKYRLIAENTADPISILDMNLQFTYISPTTMRLRGFTVEEAMKLTFAQILTPESLQIALAVYEKEMMLEASGTADPDRTRILELEEYKKDGSTIWVEASLSFLRDKDLKPVQILIVSRDITDRKRMEAEKAELEAQNRQLQKAESLGRMAGAIAHHFNNQLQVVIGNLEMAMDDLPQGSAASESMTEALKAAHKVVEVSGQMLSYLGQTPCRHEPIDLSEVCRLRFTLLQAVAPEGMILKAHFPLSGPVIHADAGQIQHVLTNLINNAWDTVEENRGSIDLTVKTVSRNDIPASTRFPADWKPQEGVYACLEVADTGSGIASKDIEKIFDPFYTTRFTGRGMGLSVVLGIVKAHNGGIAVESEPGRGSVFRVFLPVSTEEVTRSPENEGKVPEMIGGCTVLVVEDDEQVRKMVKMMLTHLGLTVLEAGDGMEAVAVFKQHRNVIRCVFSDLTMPRMDGWATLAALRKLSPDIPVILSSGYDEAHIQAGEHIERPNAFLGKPYQFKELKETIGRVLAGQK